MKKKMPDMADVGVYVSLQSPRKPPTYRGFT